MLQSCQCERVAGKIDSALVKLMKSWKKKKILLGANTGGKKKNHPPPTHQECAQ